jgi:hypothetical protein
VRCQRLFYPEGVGSRQEFGSATTKKHQRQSVLFLEGEDLPLFSGVPQTVTERLYVPEEQSWKQAMLPGMPGIDYEAVRQRDHQRQRRRLIQVSDNQVPFEDGLLGSVREE